MSLILCLSSLGRLTLPALEMSVIVSTKFSQGRVYYAGESVTCTITFTNPLPTHSTPPTNSSSTNSNRRRSSVRPNATHISRMQSPTNPSHSSSPLVRHSRQISGQHSRSQSMTLSSDTLNSKDSSLPPRNGTSHRRTESSTNSLSVYDNKDATVNRKTASFTDLATSTFAYFTGFSINDKQDEEPDNNYIDKTLQEDSYEKKANTASEDLQLQEEDEASEPSQAISIELGSIDTDTPRSSIDTQSTYIPREHDSRRSSIDSTASFSNHPHSHMYGTPRLNFMMKSTSTPSLLTKSEHLLWGFAQVVGHFVVDPAMVNASEFAQLKNRTMYRPGGGIGGGGGMLGRPSGIRQPNKIDGNSIPVFSTPPSILFVDLDILPGESKSYLYKITLPKDIPPSHKGRCIRFNYHLIIGTQRSSGNGGATSNTSMGRGHVVQMPFRVLNHVSADGSRPIYDLMNPVVLYKDEAKIEAQDSDTPKASTTQTKNHCPNPDDASRKDFFAYVDELVKSSAPVKAVKSPESESSTAKSSSPPLPHAEITRRESDVYDENGQDDNEENRRGTYITKEGFMEYTAEKNCAQIVSDVVRTGHKAMYDICKSNVRVAYLHLMKITHRLGEPIMGMLNFHNCDIPTYHINITLESYEEIEQSIALKSPQQNKKLTRKIHSEHHEFCLNSQRVAFSLPIPLMATPDFHTTGVKLNYFLRFEFLTGVQQSARTGAPKAVPPSYLPINVDERHKHYQAVQEVDISSFDCTIPIKVYGASGGVDRGMYGWSSSFVVTD
ncbi:hypothetical protein K450DRAFT_224496 [Umbelopsis ramanniana AG]|uniref:Rgp1-domain-containing protein n=1 Tax=Umbelopsis ramanniana AG TaxID=1314678 RepID=A0AAD5EHJ0_UMBRA|nr:uncharacterized protein K450DRAFT_224496 [Umbelopsis ramanniana AG]KAI8583160.1 hypothetical protein K450DRAFT_224496 [Umbelopsis ramanniana AG]